MKPEGYEITQMVEPEYGPCLTINSRKQSILLDNFGNIEDFEYMKEEIQKVFDTYCDKYLKE